MFHFVKTKVTSWQTLSSFPSAPSWHKPVQHSDSTPHVTFNVKQNHIFHKDLSHCTVQTCWVLEARENLHTIRCTSVDEQCLLENSKWRWNRAAPFCSSLFCFFCTRVTPGLACCSKGAAHSKQKSKNRKRYSYRTYWLLTLVRSSRVYCARFTSTEGDSLPHCALLCRIVVGQLNKLSAFIRGRALQPPPLFNITGLLAHSTLFTTVIYPLPLSTQ